MKFLNLLLFASLLAFCVACNDDDDDDPCIATTLEETIVGKWIISESNTIYGDVEFTSDGTLIDPEDLILGFPDVDDEKYYVVDSESAFTVFSTHDGSTIEVEFDVASFSCDEIHLEVIGIEFLMSRK